MAEIKPFARTPEAPLSAEFAGFPEAPVPPEFKGKKNLGTALRPVVVDLETLAQEDVTAQREGGGTEDSRAKFEDILSSTSWDEITAKGVSDIGGTKLSPTFLQDVRNDPQQQAELFIEFNESVAIPQREVGEIASPFATGDYGDIRMPEVLKSQPAYVQESFMEIATKTAGFAKLLSSDSVLPPEGKDLIFEGFKTGSLWNEMARTTRDIPGDFARLPTVGSMGISALYAAGSATASFLDDDEDYDDAFGRHYKDAMTAQSPFLTGLDNFLNKTVVFERAASRLDGWYKEAFIEKHGQDMYEAYHTRPKFDTEIVDGQPQLVPVLDEEGNQVLEDVGLGLDSAQAILDFSYNALDNWEKAAAFLGPELPLAVTTGGLTLSKNTSRLAKIDNARAENPTVYAGKSDIEVWKGIRNQDANIAQRAFGNTWNLLTFGNMRAKSGLGLTQTYRTHLDVISGFNTDIANLERKIDSGELVGEALETAQDELEFIKNNKVSYTRSRGYGSYDNPYSRALVTDSVLISAAVGYAPAIMEWADFGLNEQVSQALSGIVAPIVTPTLARAGVGTIRAVGDTMFMGTVTDIGLTLENSTYLPFITENMLVKGDIGAVRQALADRGMEITPGAVDSFRTMKKIFDKMTPEGRTQTFAALQQYNQMMQRIQKRMVDLNIYNEDELVERTSALHLSVAHATGLAPLIAVQNLEGHNIKITDLTQEGSLQKVLDALKYESKTYEGMNTILEMFEADFARSGVSFDDNDQLQEFLAQMETVVQNGEANLTAKRIALEEQLATFYNDPAKIDENSVANLAAAYEELRPGGAEVVEGFASKEKALQDSAVQLLKDNNDFMTTLRASAFDMNEQDLLNTTRPIADNIIDITMGYRKETASLAYGEVDNYKLPGTDEVVTIDMGGHVRKLMDLSEDLRGKPIAYLFQGGSKFFTVGGATDAQRVFEGMAMRGLSDWIGSPDAVEAMKDARGLETYSELALELAEKAKNPEAALTSIFRATPQEAESISRYFRDRHLVLVERGDVDPKLAYSIAQGFEEVMDTAYKNVSVDFFNKVKAARYQYQVGVGEVTERGTYAGGVLKNRQRKLEAGVEGGELYIYATESNKPLKPYERIADAVAELAITPKEDILTIQKLEREIIEQKERLMFFLGGARTPEGAAFDMTNPVQVEIAKQAENLLTTLVSNRTIRALESKVYQGPSSGRYMRSPEQVKAMVRVKEMKVAQGSFEAARRILDAEQLLSVPILPSGKANKNDIQYRRLAVADDIGTFGTQFDQLMQNDQAVRETYTAQAAELNDARSPIRMAAQAEVDAEKRAIKKSEAVLALASNPQNFFDKYFLVGSEDSISTLKKTMEAGGLTPDEIDIGLKTLFVRGLMAKAGLQHQRRVGYVEAEKGVQNINVIDDFLSNKATRKVAISVLGKDHVEALDDAVLWNRYAEGDGRGFRARASIRSMDVNNVIARSFNYARGMVSLPYLAAEQAARLMSARNQNMISMALMDTEAAGVMADILVKPDVSVKEIERLHLRMKYFILNGEGGILREGGDIPAIDVFMGESATVPLEELSEQAQAQEQAEQREVSQQ